MIPCRTESVHIFVLMNSATKGTLAEELPTRNIKTPHTHVTKQSRPLGPRVLT